MQVMVLDPGELSCLYKGVCVVFGMCTDLSGV